MRVIDRIIGHEERLSLQDFMSVYDSVTHNGNLFPFTTYGTTTGNTEKGTANDQSSQIYRSNAVLFSCIRARASVFSEARFQWRQIRAGRPGDLFGTPELAVLEHPWPNGTTGELLVRMEQDATLEGNFFAVRRGDELKRLTPRWTDIVRGSPQADDDNELNFSLLGYMYRAGGHGDPQFFAPDEVAHYSPIPDPMNTFRGMSWVTPVIRELAGDTAATDHKLAFWRNAATPNMTVKFDPTVTEDRVRQWMALLEEQHAGRFNAYKTLALGGGADATVVGTDFKQMDFKAVQGAGETRIAAAAGVPPIIAGFSEGLASATYSNYGQARRHFADATLRPLWRIAAASLAAIIQVPPNAELWYDDRDIPFLQEDEADDANIQATRAATIRTLIEAGYEPDAVIDAVESDDLARLKGHHSGLYSVQLMGAGAPHLPDPEVLPPDDPGAVPSAAAPTVKGK